MAAFSLLQQYRTKRIHITPLVTTTFLLGYPAFCHAAASHETADMTAALLRTIWSLLFVIALILLLYGIFRKRFSPAFNQQNKAIKILELRALPGRKSLCLVEVEGKKLLLGVAENAISCLSELPNIKNFDETLHHYQKQECQEQNLRQEQDS